MKLFVAVSTLLATGALGQSPAPKPEADTDIGQTECERVNSVTGETDVQICEYYQECHTSKNDTLSACMPKGNQVCEKYSEFGTSGDVISWTACEAYQTCCDGTCCGVNQQCMEVWNSNDRYSYGYSDPQVLNNIARNDWKTKKGVSFANKPRKCVNLKDAPIMDVTTGMKAVYLPMLGLGVTALIFIIAIVKRQDTFLEMLFPLLTIFFSFFLVLTTGWVMSLLCTFVAAATMASGDQDKKWVVWFQVFFLWFYFGGSSGFIFTQHENEIKNFFTEVSGEKSIKQLSEDCSTHFDYYKLNPIQIPFNQDPENIYTGICGREFIGYQVFIAYGQAFSLFLMIATNVVGYLNPGESSATTKNPASGVEMGA